MTFPLKFVFSTVMYFSAKRRFNPGTSDSQLNGESPNELLFMVGTPNILFPLVAYHGRVLLNLIHISRSWAPYPERAHGTQKAKVNAFS